MVGDSFCNAGPVTLEKISVLKGANFFSGGPVIHMRTALNEYDEVYTSEIDGFYQGLSMTLPTLIEHHCSEGMRGGFFIRVKDGTLLGHVIEHVAIELQTLGGMDVSYGKTRSTLTPGVYNIVFRYFNELAGLYAGKAAIQLVNSILKNEPFDVIPVIARLIELKNSGKHSEFTEQLIHEASERQIPWMYSESKNSVMLGSGKYQQWIPSSMKTIPDHLANTIHTPDEYLNYLFSQNQPDHIPLIAITGSYGKTSCAELIAKGLKLKGMNTATSTSNGVFFGNLKTDAEFQSGNPHTELLLQSNDIDIAVCEIPAESIFISGLSYQLSDIGVVLNVADVHLKELDVKKIEDIAYAKSVVAEEVRSDGYAILNACDDYTAEMADRVYSGIAWFSHDKNNTLTRKLLNSNAIVSISDGNSLNIFRNGHSIFHAVIENQMLFDRKGFVYDSVNAAILTLHLLGVDAETILKTIQE